MSRSYRSPLPKGAPYLGDPAQIVKPQNEFVIRKDAGAVKKDRWVEKRFKRDVSLNFLRFAITKLTKKKTEVVTLKNNRKEMLEALETKGSKVIQKRVQSMRESQNRLKLLIGWYDNEIEECRAEINARINDNSRHNRKDFEFLQFS